MKRKIYALLLAFATITSMNCTAYAAGNIDYHIDSNIEIASAIDGISDVPITEEMKEKVQAGIIDENGNITPLDIEMTIRELPSVSGYNTNAQGEKKYALSVYASTSKVESNTEDVNKSNYGVVANGYLRMDWTDVSGTNNTLDDLEGYWDIDEGNLDYATVDYGSSHNRVADTKIVSDDFTWSSINYTSRNLHATYWADFSGVDADGAETRVEVFVCVDPSILD